MLTKRQQEVLDFLNNSRSSNHLMPSTREIQNHFGFASQTAAVDILRALERKGALRRLPGKARGIILTDPPPDSESSPLRPILRIPLYGVIAAGYADASPQNSGEFLLVDPLALGLQSSTHCFALKVRGDSMINAHILDGDYIILDSRQRPAHHDIVAALIDDQTTLKRLMIQGSRRWLRAENPLFPDLIPATDLQIQGVMRALIRGSDARPESHDDLPRQ